MKISWFFTTASNAKRSRKRIFLVSFAMLSALILTWLVVPSKPRPIQNLGDSWVFRENQTAPIIGDLGGVPVSISKPYAHFVEYDSDPHFMEQRKGPPPKHTFQSKLRSFGFEIRYPDMAALTDETAKQQRLETIYTTTWMRVGINSNSYYGSAGDAFLETKIAAIPAGNYYRYKELPGRVHDLSGYTPLGIDKSRRGYGVLVDGKVADMNDENIYFHRDQDGKADAYIKCSNMLHEAASCELKFNMLPTMRAHVSVSFRKELLPHWKEIRSSVTQVILGFRVHPSSTAPQQGK